MARTAPAPDTARDERWRERDSAILDAVDAIDETEGLLAIRMSKVAARVGITTKQLNKHYPNAHAMLRAWNERESARHLAQFTAIADQPGHPVVRLERVLKAYATVAQERRHDDANVRALLDREQPVTYGKHGLRHVLTRLIHEAVDTGRVRTDVPAAELAQFCLNAVAATGGTRSAIQTERLVDVTLDALSPVHRGAGLNTD